MAAVVPKYAMLLIVYVNCGKLTKCSFYIVSCSSNPFFIVFFIKKDMNVRVCVSAYMP